MKARQLRDVVFIENPQDTALHRFSKLTETSTQLARFRVDRFLSLSLTLSTRFSLLAGNRRESTTFAITRDAYERTKLETGSFCQTIQPHSKFENGSSALKIIRV